MSKYIIVPIIIALFMVSATGQAADAKNKASKQGVYTVKDKSDNRQWNNLYNNRKTTIDAYINNKVKSLIEEGFFDASVTDVYEAGLMTQLGNNNGQAILIDENGKRYIKIVFSYKENGDLDSVGTSFFDKDIVAMLENQGLSIKAVKQLITQFNIEGYGTSRLGKGILSITYDYNDQRWISKKSVSYANKQEHIGITKAFFINTIWKGTIENGDPPQTFIKFRADGTFEFNNNKPSSFLYKGTETWKVVGSDLILNWSSGFNHDKFSLNNTSSEVFFGVRSIGSKRMVLLKVK